MFKLIHAQNNLWYGQFSIFPQDKVIHAISTRFNGHSKAPFDSLNLALHVNDNPDDVIANRQLFCEGLNLDSHKMTTCKQVHGNKVACITEENIGSGAISFANSIDDTDALITNLKNVPLTLFFADCTPIMIYDPKNNAIGVAHGGWRGTVGEIAKYTVAEMTKHYHTNPSDCLASIGPSIGACCYEIGDEVVAKFSEVFQNDSDKILNFNQNSKKYHLDLWQANAITLQRAGVLADNIDMANTCTACNKDVFFSYRADNGKTGRIASIISLR